MSFDWKIARVRWAIGLIGGIVASLESGGWGLDLVRGGSVGLLTAIVVDLGAWTNAQKGLGPGSGE